MWLFKQWVGYGKEDVFIFEFYLWVLCLIIEDIIADELQKRDYFFLLLQYFRLFAS